MAAEDAPLTDLTPLPAYSDDLLEAWRYCEKIARDYSITAWAGDLGRAVKLLRRFLTANDVPILPPADVVAMHMRMSEGAVRMVYEGIRAVSKAGGVLPALAEMQARSEAAEAADKEKAAPRRRPMTSAAPTPTEAVAFVPRRATVPAPALPSEAPPRRKVLAIPPELKIGFFS